MPLSFLSKSVPQLPHCEEWLGPGASCLRTTHPVENHSGQSANGQKSLLVLEGAGRRGWAGLFMTKCRRMGQGGLAPMGFRRPSSSDNLSDGPYGSRRHRTAVLTEGRPIDIWLEREGKRGS